MSLGNCRTCSSSRKNMRSIFETTKSPDGIKYSEMVTTIANVKISEGDGYSEQICLPCCRKVRDCFDFKLLVERTNTTIIDEPVKRINFNNLIDVKMEMNLVKVETENGRPQSPDINLNFNGNENLTYRNVTIKKVKSERTLSEEDKKPLTILDFLNTFKAENDFETNDYMEDNYGPNSSEDDDTYLPNRKDYKKSTSKKKKRKHRDPDDEEYVPGQDSNKSKLKKSKSKDNTITMCIKPKLMKDLKLVPAQKPKKWPKTDPKQRRKHDFICPYCGILTSSHNKYHMLTHTGERSFKCAQCPKAYFSQVMLNLHMKIHTGERNFKCDQCIAAFYNMGSLKSHKLSHITEKSHVCDVCNKAFRRKNQMRRHRERHNIANKKVKCDECPMTFFCKAARDHHMRIHTGERPYKCEICSQPYSYKHDFNRHCYKVHGIFLKRRRVNIMNQEVLQRELAFMQEVMLRNQGIITEEDAIKPIESEGPQAVQAFKMAAEHLQSDKSVFPFNTGVRKRKTSELN